MNLLDAIQPYLYGPDDTISHEYEPAAYRLTAEDKLSLEKAILVRGAKAIENVTKGGAVLYQRTPQRFSGEDEAYLRSLFAPGTETATPWNGPDHIVVSQHDSDSSGVIMVESYSPFEDRFLCLPYTKKLDGADGMPRVTSAHCPESTMRCFFLGMTSSLPPYRGCSIEGRGVKFGWSTNVLLGHSEALRRSRRSISARIKAPAFTSIRRGSLCCFHSADQGQNPCQFPGLIPPAQSA